MLRALQRTTRVTESARRMFAIQSELPRLPVPALDRTLEKYLKTVKPLCSLESYTQTQQIVEKFVSEGEGPKLQRLLEQRAENSVSWLADWWLHCAYLDYREPCVINSNPGMVMPKENFESNDQWLTYAAKFIRGAMEYKSMIDDKRLPVEHLAGKPLCMLQYYKIFSSCRIPGLKRDSLVCYPSNEPSAPRHILVLHNNHFFSVDVYGADGQLLNEKQIHKLLNKVVSRSSDAGPGIGILTAGHRNTWGQLHQRLQRLGNNASHLQKIERSIFAICLDGVSQTSQDASADEFSRRSRQMLYGDGAQSMNRWFDKTIQFVIGRDGNCGLNYEHSPAEGPPIASLLDFVQTYCSSSKDHDPAKGTTEPERLDFNIDKTIQTAIENAKTQLDMLGAELQLTAAIFDGYGKNFAKAKKLSPDALIQVAMQLAYFRDQGHPCATYETASTRMFQQGRTDTIRSCSAESLAFCTAMQQEGADCETLVRLLREAVEAHRKYTTEAVAGQAVDRHLLGLKLIALESGMNVPSLHMDPTYTRAMHFNLSTSQVASKSRNVLCFGPVVPDGYGFCYNPRDDDLLYVISAFRSSPETDPIALAKRLKDSLLDIKGLFSNASKL